MVDVTSQVKDRSRLEVFFRCPWLDILCDKSFNHPPTMCSSLCMTLVSNKLCKFVREGVARDEWRKTHARALFNEADVLTKTLSKEKRKGFIRMILNHVFHSC